MPPKILWTFAAGFLGGLLLTSCREFAKLPEAEPTLVEPITARRDGPRGPYTLQSILPADYEIFASTQPSGLSGKRGERLGVLPAGAPDTPSMFVATSLASDRRYYFQLVDEAGDMIEVSERRLQLEGSDNFRDLGGLPAADGRHVRWGQFYRADKLSDLTNADLAYLASIDLQTVVDLRSEEEVAGAPDVIPVDSSGAEVSYLHLPIYNEAEDTTDIRGRILDGTFGTEEADNLLVEVNRLLATSEAYRFQPFIDLVKSGDGVPVVYHCTSGKDRTGFATFLLLHALGVDSAMVFDDYLMSNYYRFDRNRRNLRKVNLAQYVKPVNPNVLKPLMLVDPAYLQAGVDEIESSYGSVDTFLTQVYGLTPDNIERLRKKYLY